MCVVGEFGVRAGLHLRHVGTVTGGSALYKLYIPNMSI